MIEPLLRGETLRRLGSGPLNFASAYGIKADNTTDNTTKLSNAINTISAAGGGKLFLDPGTTLHSGIELLSDVLIIGMGHHASRLKLANGSNTHNVKLHASSNGTSDPNAEFCGLMDVMVDGNKANQTGTSHGIYIQPNPLWSQASGDYDFDLHPVFSNVYLRDVKTDGFNHLGRSEAHLFNVFAYYCGNYGFNLSADTFASHCSSGQSGNDAWYVNNSNFMLSVCKGWYGGAGAGTPAGFHFTTGAGGVLSSCMAQDNRGQGFLFDGCGSISATGLLADSNSTSSSGSYPGYDLWNAQGCQIIGSSIERKADGSHSYQQNALQMRSSSSGNHIILSHRGINGATIGSNTMGTLSSASGNSIWINGSQVQ